MLVVMGPRWPVLAFGWPMLVVVGPRWPALAVVGLCWLLGGLRWLSWVLVGLCWSSLSSVGLCWLNSGPGKHPDDPTQNGQYEPSWIWLVAHNPSLESEVVEEDFNDSMQVEWVKVKARAARWNEELLIVPSGKIFLTT
jgi:hypothetical protein